MIVGERLEELRKDKGLSQTALAEELGVKPNTISAYERETSGPSDEIKIQIAKLFNVSIDYLLGIIDEEVPYTRDNYIILPKGYPPEMRKDILDYLELLKLKYKINK